MGIAHNAHIKYYLRNKVKDRIRSGIAGTSIVSAYRTIVATELNIITTLHEETGIFFPDGGVCDCNIIIITISLAFLFLSRGYLILYLRIASDHNNNQLKLN
jgi:hypothetical protein